MGKEFRILKRLNKDHLDPEEYRKVVGDDEAVLSEDFSTEDLTVTCG